MFFVSQIRFTHNWNAAKVHILFLTLVNGDVMNFVTTLTFKWTVLDYVMELMHIFRKKLDDHIGENLA